MDGEVLLPDSWTIVELTGPEDVTHEVPALTGELRRPGCFRGIIDEGELSSGRLRDWLSKLKDVLSRPRDTLKTGPYR
jgi:hypothetical protein